MLIMMLSQHFDDDAGVDVDDVEDGVENDDYDGDGGGIEHVDDDVDGDVDDDGVLICL